MAGKNSEPGFGFYAKNYFGNDYRYFYNNQNLIFCRPLLLNNVYCENKNYYDNYFKNIKKAFFH